MCCTRAYHTNLPRTNPAVTKPIGHLWDSLTTGSCGIQSSHLLEGCSLKYEPTDDWEIWSPPSLFSDLQHTKEVDDISSQVWWALRNAKQGLVLFLKNYILHGVSLLHWFNIDTNKYSWSFTNIFISSFPIINPPFVSTKLKEWWWNCWCQRE